MHGPTRAARALVPLILAVSLAAQITTPPVVIKGAAPSAEVWAPRNNQTCTASLADGSIAALGYKQDSSSSGGRLYLWLSRDGGRKYPFQYPLPQGGGHQVHDPYSATLTAGRACNHLHVFWSDRSVGGTLLSAYYQLFDTSAGKWVGQPSLLAQASSSSGAEFRVADCNQSESGTLVVAIETGAQGGLGMGAHECGLMVKKRGAAGFSALQPFRSSGAPAWAKAMSIDCADEIVHCSAKSQSGGGGIVYRSFDTVSMQWQQSAPVPIGPNNNGIAPLSGIDASNRSVLAADTAGNVYVLYSTGSQNGLQNNNKLRLAYAQKGKGGSNQDWSDIEILSHNAAVGANPRQLQVGDAAYPQLRGGDTDPGYYTLAPGIDGSMGVIYSKPWETFKSMYVQVYQWGKVVILTPTGVKEIDFWPDTEPYIFERLCGMRAGHSVGMGGWLVYSHTDTLGSVQAPQGMLRMWLLTFSTGRSISFGVGCQGQARAAPRIHANRQFPQIGFNYYLSGDRFSPLANFLLMGGTKCQHIDLGFLGAAGCALEIDFPVLIAQQANFNGQYSATFLIPNQSSLIDESVFMQCFVFDRSANSFGAITSNALRAILSN